MHRLLLPVRHDLVHEEGPHAEQHPVAGTGGVGEDQGRVDQPVQQVDRVAGRADGGRQHLDRGEVDAAGERCHRPQQALLVLAEQPVRRVDGRPEGALPVVVAAPAGGEVEGTAEPVAHGAQRHHRHLAGGELDPERQPVQAAQHLDQVVGVGGGQLEVGPPAPGMVDERPYGRLPPRASRSEASRGTGSGWRRTTYSPGTCRVMREVASTRTVRREATQRDDEVAAGVEQVLAVVEEQEQVATGQAVRDVPGRDLSGGAQAERRRDGRADPLGRSTAARSTKTASAPGAPPGSAATSRASRVFPTPPVPVRVTSALVPSSRTHLLAVVLAADHRAVRARDPARSQSGGRERWRDRAGGDALLELGQGGPRVEAGLVGEPPPKGLGGGHRVGGAAVGRERPHVEERRALAERRRRGGRGRIDDDRTVGQRQPGLDQVVDELEAQLVEPDRLHLQRGQPAELGERGATPERQRAPGQLRGDGRRRLGPGDRALEPTSRVGVQLVGLQEQAVAAGVPLQAARRAGRGARAAGTRGCTAPGRRSRGGSSGQSPSTSRSALTPRPASSASIASSARRRTPGTSTASPATRSTSGPRTSTHRAREVRSRLIGGWLLARGRRRALCPSRGPGAIRFAEAAKHSVATQARKRSTPTASTRPAVCETWLSSASTLRSSTVRRQRAQEGDLSSVHMRGRPRSNTP